MRDSLPQTARFHQPVRLDHLEREDSRVGEDDEWLAQGLTHGRLHEVFAGAAEGAGFALATALAGGATPLLWLRTQACERNAGRIYATGLVELGLDPHALVLGIVPDDRQLLRAAAEAARCPGLGAVLVESWGPACALDLTASRRLKLAAEASGVTVIVLRIAAEPMPSAAETRWGVCAVPSLALETNAPGGPMFDVELLRRRGGPAGRCWRVEWMRDDLRFRIAPVSGAGVSLAPDRVAQGPPPAPVRRAG